MALTDEEFSTKFHAEATHLRKIQLAIVEERYTIWTRFPPNFPNDYLKPILRLHDSTAVTSKQRKSGGKGLSYVLELKYEYREMGNSLKMYLKGYFTQSDDGKLVIEFTIQSLRSEDEESL